VVQLTGAGQENGAKRLVLGFDGGRMTCSDLARRIEDHVGDKLEVRSLRDPQVAHWREQALGEDAPWTPTLVEVNGGEFKAWTGIRMGARLSWALGPVASWQVIQVLGEIGAENRVEDSTASRALSRMNRGQFIKGVGGAAVGVSVLSGLGPLASLAKAAPSGDAAIKSVGSEEITGEELKSIGKEVAARTDMVNIMGEGQSQNWSSSYVIRQCQNGECYTVVGNEGSCSVRQVNGQISVEGDCAIVRASRHELEGGNRMLAVAYQRSDQIVVYYEYDSPVFSGESETDVISEAKIWEFDNKDKPENLLLRKSSHNGGLDTPILESEGGFSTQATCSGCKDPVGPGDRDTGYQLGNVCKTKSVATCVRYSIGCGAGLVPCAFPTVPNIAACVAALAVACPGAVAKCCGSRQKACVKCPNPFGTL